MLSTVNFPNTVSHFFLLFYSYYIILQAFTGYKMVKTFILFAHHIERDRRKKGMIVIHSINTYSDAFCNIFQLRQSFYVFKVRREEEKTAKQECWWWFTSIALWSTEESFQTSKYLGFLKVLTKIGKNMQILFLCSLVWIKIHTE